MTREFGHALRSLLRHRGFSVAAVLTLALGIGAATAIFSVVDTIMLRPLPFADGDRLVRVIEWMPHPVAGRPPLPRGLAYPEYLDWQRQARTLIDSIATIALSQRMVRTPDGAAGLWGTMASLNTFDSLQVRPLLGRTFAPDDAVHPDVVILSHDTWQRHYHGDPDIVGKALEFRTGALLAPIPPRLLTVIGVMPASFEFPGSTFDFFTPIVIDPSAKRPPSVSVVARLAPGVTQEEAAKEVLSLGEAIRAPLTAPLPVPRFEVRSIRGQLLEPVRPAMRVLLAAVVVLMVIVCANVANLMLARGVTGRKEIAVRLALGASRGRIIRQVFAECLLIGAIGGVIGAVLSAGGVLLVKQLATVDAPGIFRLMFGSTVLPRAGEIGVSWRLAVIASGMAAASCVLFGLLPALHLSRSPHLYAFQSHDAGHGRMATRMRAALVTAQIVLATIVLVGGGLLAHSFLRLSSFNKGYDPAQVLAFNLLMPDQYPVRKKADTIRTILERLRSKPGVQSAGFARHGLLIGEELVLGFWVPPGRALDQMKDERIRVRSVSDGFLTAMGVPILAGRDLAPADDATGPPVIVINRAAAARYFGPRPVGDIVDWHLGKAVIQVTVVGIAENVRQEHATDDLAPEIFVDYRQYMNAEFAAAPETAERRQNETAIGFLSFAVRTGAAPASLIPAVRESIAAVDPNIGVDAIAPMTSLEASAVARERFYAVIVAVFAVVSGLLAVIGVYGVLAYSVVQRTREIGVRMAVGARRSQVTILVVKRGVMLTVIGLSVGLVGAAALSRSLASMLFGIEPLDVVTFLQVAAGFIAVASAAAYLPARRAARIDPVIALRHE